MKPIVITQPPYSGKGTQCKILNKREEIIHISTGEYIRSEKERETEFGKIMSQYADSGDLVPDELMKNMINDLIQSNVNPKGIILDGYPRTVKQVDHLLEILKDQNLEISHVLNIEVPITELLERAKNRAESSDREDDKDPAIHIKRIRDFENLSIPAIQYLKEKTHVLSFDGLGKIEEISTKIKASIS